MSESRAPSLRSLARSVPAVVRRDYLTSTVAHWLSLASGLLLFHLVARRDGVAGFTYYQVARGAVATLQPVALLGLVPALHRYLPRAGGRVRVLARQSFLVQVVLMDLIALLGLALAHDVGRLLGIAGGVPAVRAVILLAAGNCLCVITVAALRGCGQVHLANLVWLLGLGLLPLATFALTPRIEVFLALQGIAMIVLAFGGMAVAGPRRAERTRPVTDPPRLRTLLRYGIRRVPGDIALPALFAFPTFFVATVTRGGPETSYVGFATSAITLICALFGMLTPVLLPRLSGHLQHAAPAATLGRGLRVLPIAAAALAALVAGGFAAVATPVVHGFLGPEFDDAAGVLRLALPAAVPLAAFYAARPALDALQETPVITRLLLGCLALEILVTHGLGRLTSAGNAAVLGLGAAAGALGVLTYLALRHAVPAR